VAGRIGTAAKWIGLLLAVTALPLAAREPAAEEGAVPQREAPGDPEPAQEDLPEEVVPPLLEQRADLLRRVDELLVKFDGMTPQLEGVTGEERLVLLGQIGRLELEILELYDKLATNAADSGNAGLDTSELEAFFARELPGATSYLIELIDRSQADVLALAQGREEIPREQLIEHEERLAGHNARIDHYYEILLGHADRLERVGLDGSEARTYVLTELPVRADRISGRVELARNQIRALEKRLRESRDDPAAELELRATRIKLASATASLRQEARLLDTLGVPTSQYRQLLIRATGSLTEDIFDTEVARGLIDEAVDDAREWVARNGATAAFRLLLFVLIVMAAAALGRLIGRIVSRALQASRLRTSEVLQQMFATLVRRTVLLLGVLFGLSQLGVEIGPLLAGIGIVGFAVGFALQDTLSNFASGAMLLIYRPFDAGDVIEASGVLGTVDHLSLVNTTLLTFDNRKIVVPNNKIWGDVITNITAMEIRRVDLVVGVAHSEKVVRVEELLLDVVKTHPKVLEDPAPLIKVDKLGEASVDFGVRAWARREDYWNVRWDLTRAIKLRFEEEGVELARPRHQVALEPEGAGDEPASGQRSG
jgi:small conductance mechanosensitive channel